jgi:hypothetical protein
LTKEVIPTDTISPDKNTRISQKKTSNYSPEPTTDFADLILKINTGSFLFRGFSQCNKASK